MFHPRGRKKRVRRRGKKRKNTKRRVEGIPAAVGLTLKPFTPVTLKGKKRAAGTETHFYFPFAYTHNVMHRSTGLLLLCTCGWCVCPCRPQAAPLSSRFSWLDDLQSPTEQPFCVDRKADTANWTYKSLYRGDVARYTHTHTHTHTHIVTFPASAYSLQFITNQEH